MAAAAVRAVAQPYLGERLGRGMVGIWSGTAMFLSWRMLPTDPDTMAFDEAALRAETLVRETAVKEENGKESAI